MTETPISSFLKEHNIQFVENTGHLEILENGVPVSLENTYKAGVCYLRSRLGPEFITQLSAFLNRPDIAQDYLSNSTYYCYEYLVLLNMVIFDNNATLDQNEKPEYFLEQLLNRLFEYATSDSKYMFDHDNPCLRLNDQINLSSSFYLTREHITSDMLH